MAKRRRRSTSWKRARLERVLSLLSKASADLHMSTCKISFNKCSTYMARAAVLSTFSLSTLFWRSTATADSEKSLTGIPITCLLAPPSLLLKSISAIKESREVRLEAALVFTPSEELEEFFRVSTCFLAGLLSMPFLLACFFDILAGFMGDIFLADGLSEFFMLIWGAGVSTSALFGGQRANDSRFAVPLDFSF